MNDPVMICRAVPKRYKKTQVLDGLDLTIHAGSIVGLLGKNGAGKSTLIN